MAEFTGESSRRTYAEARAAGHTEMVVSAKASSLWAALMQCNAVAAARRLAEMFALEDGRVVLVATRQTYAPMTLRGREVEVDAPAHTIGGGGDA